jgi:DNA-binding GntR family transcriptional regulator
VKTEIIKLNYADQIYNTLKRDILHHRISFGEKITNKDLRKRFGVSSTPVRDAINRLYFDGFLQEISNAGARVMDFNLKFALEINEIVSMLMNEAMLFIEEKMIDTERIGQKLQQVVLDQKESRTNNDEEAYFELDSIFHLTLVNLTNNSRFINLFKHNSTLLEVLTRKIYIFNDEHRDVAISQHESICIAYMNRNYALARLQMKEHYASVIRYFKSAIFEKSK